MDTETVVLTDEDLREADELRKWLRRRDRELAEKMLTGNPVALLHALAEEQQRRRSA